MKSSVKSFLARLRKEAVRRPDRVEITAMGRRRFFRAYDLGDDTFVFERGVWTDLDRAASVLMAEKRDLSRGARGHVMTVTTGNHSVAALPLLAGKFWDLAKVPQAKRGDVMFHAVLCANVVAGKFEVSQRDVPCAKLVALDGWLTGALGLGMADVVFLDRNEATLEHYRALGCEWRVRPLAWTENEMRTALAASRKKISSWLRYYHSARGVHFLSYAEFHALAGRARTDFAAFRAGLHELVRVFEGHEVSFTRQPKYHGHHEIEFFGMRRGMALEKLVPELEKLMEGVVLGRLAPAAAADRMAALDQTYLAALVRPELADEASRAFIESLYMHITGEIYSVAGEGSAPAFDDRRAALPGATFVNGRPHYHAGTDARSEVLLSNIRALTSKDEIVEYANVYELRGGEEDGAEPGAGNTREVVFKTNRRPLVRALVEKKLSRPGSAYGSYVLARVECFKALGVELPDYRLLRRRAGMGKRRFDYYIRSRCEGEPLADVPANYFQVAGEFGGAEAGEDPQVVEALAFLMGDAAAQNLAMKKYDAATKTPCYGVGKEIYFFGYDIKAGRTMPKSVSCCSVRGSFGWPDTDFTEENVQSLTTFYMRAYAAALAEFAAAHPAQAKGILAERFLDGFEFRTRQLEWRLSVLRDEFEAFDPRLPSEYGFDRKWRFALWSLERQARRVDRFKDAFRVALCAPAAFADSGAATDGGGAFSETYAPDFGALEFVDGLEGVRW